MADASPFAVVLVTAPKISVALALARTLVDERLAACVNVVPGLRSLYRWKGKVRHEPELLCLIKTRHALLDRLIDRVRALHPYGLPEIIALPLIAGSAPYLAWVAAATRPARRKRRPPPGKHRS